MAAGLDQFTISSDHCMWQLIIADPLHQTKNYKLNWNKQRGRLSEIVKSVDKQRLLILNSRNLIFHTGKVKLLIHQKYVAKIIDIKSISPRVVIYT